MSVEADEDRTLGLTLGRTRGRRLLPDATRRVIRAAAPGRATIGTGFIGLGAQLIVGVRIFFGLAELAAQWGAYPDPWLALVGWVVLLVGVTFVLIVARIVGGRLPGWAFGVYLACLGASMIVDLASVWSLQDVGEWATAASAAGMSLLVVLTLRRTRDLLLAVAGLGLLLAAGMAWGTDLGAGNLAEQITTLAFTVVPVVLGVGVVRGFRRLVQVELDRTLVQGTVNAPRYAVGLMASEELARLDLAAEELLDSVAFRRVPLPLPPETASTAASLATELRLHLLEGRRETWLHHAISESDLLGKSVTLNDKKILAGLLSPAQRDGLLSAVWMLVADVDRLNESRAVEITVGPGSTAYDGRRMGIPILITTRNVPRNRVEQSAWDAFAKVGEYSDSTQNSSLRVDIRCLVDDPDPR